jgi:SDR family mycofactocin-dependent oxidoreductase
MGLADDKETLMGRVQGKVALVTGAARGQGRSHAVRLAEEGADIIAVDVCAPIDGVEYEPATADDLAQTVKEVQATGRRILASTVDVRDRAALKAAIDGGVAELGRLDIVVANAGICIARPWDEVTPEIWRDTIDINLTGVWNTVQQSAQHVIDAGGGSIVMISSAAGLKGLPFLSPYVASKHALVGLMRAYAQELAEYSVRVNSIHPAGVDTPMGNGGGMSGVGGWLAAHPKLGGILVNSMPVEIMQPSDITNAVLFLASDDSRYVTGLTMTVDAGNTGY